MTKDELLQALIMIKEGYGYDEEVAHVRADELLLKYIDDESISQAFENIDKWYA